MYAQENKDKRLPLNIFHIMIFHGLKSLEDIFPYLMNKIVYIYVFNTMHLAYI